MCEGIGYFPNSFHRDLVFLKSDFNNVTKTSHSDQSGFVLTKTALFVVATLSFDPDSDPDSDPAESPSERLFCSLDRGPVKAALIFSFLFSSIFFSDARPA